MEIKAVLLDADGVLFDSREWSLKYYFLAAENLGLRIPTRKEFLAAWALPWQEFLNTLWPSIDALTFDRAVNKLDKEPIPAVPGAKKIVLWLKSRRFFLGLISNRVRVSLEKEMGQAKVPFEFFNYVQAVNDFRFAKPDPRVFNPVLSLLAERGIPRSKAIFVGDTLSDLEAAKGAGITFVGVLTGGATKEQFLAAGLDESHILDSITDLPKFLEGGNL